MFVSVADRRPRVQRSARAARFGFAAVAALAGGIVVGFAGGYISAQRLLALPAASVLRPAASAGQTAPLSSVTGTALPGGDVVKPESESKDARPESRAVPAEVPTQPALGREAVPESGEVPVRPQAPSAVDRQPAGISVEPRVPVATSLRARGGSIEVLSRPSGANVALDGRLMGQTPLTIPNVQEGTHVIGIELTGFSRWATSVRVEPGKPTRIGASLTP